MNRAIAFVLGFALTGANITAAFAAGQFRPGPAPLAANPGARFLYHLTCSVSGGGEFPDGLTFANSGPGSVPVGTMVRWTLGSRVGHYRFATALAAGTSQIFPHALLRGSNAGVCEIETRREFSAGLGCAVTGSAEFPQDITLTNRGPDTIPAGAVTRWSVFGISVRADRLLYTFATPLSPGRSVVLSRVLDHVPAPGTLCDAGWEYY